MSPQQTRRATRLGRPAEHYAEIDSTNRRALAWAEAGAPDGALVVADHQTAGRGRHGRTWSDEPGLNLLFSVILRPGIRPARLSLVQLAAAVAVAEGIAPFVEPIEPALKWPNDVLLEGRKTCGILAESEVRAEKVVVALGIGLNVNQADFPEAIAERTTSLRLVGGRIVPREPLLGALLDRLEHWDDRLRAGEHAAVTAAFTERMTGIGGEATIRVGGGAVVEGTIEGLEEDGALLLRTREGRRRYHAGEVSLHNPAHDAP